MQSRSQIFLSNMIFLDQLALIHHLQESIRLMDKAQIIKVDVHQ
ncbi:hypothetical protein [Paucilactobacillus suebicus]|nr:hypothetical protein [Paucilactobacillus suebicus]